jgi:hypothetical protein
LVSGCAEIRNGLEFGSLNLSIGALYLIAAMKREDQQNARNAIIEAAKQDRVTRSKAKLIIELEERKLSIEFEELCTRNRTSPAEPEPAIEPEETSRLSTNLCINHDFCTEPLNVRYVGGTDSQLMHRHFSVGRVGMWRGGCRLSISVAASFVWRCLSGSAMAPFPHPAHR